MSTVANMVSKSDLMTILLKGEADARCGIDKLIGKIELINVLKEVLVSLSSKEKTNECEPSDNDSIKEFEDGHVEASA